MSVYRKAGMSKDEPIGCKGCGWKGQVKDLRKGESLEDLEEGFVDHALLCPSCEIELASTIAGGVMVIQNGNAITIDVDPAVEPC